jgi:DNA-binding NtrC family response regulator
MSVAPDSASGSAAPAARSQPLPDRTVRVLAVSSAEEDLRFLRHLFAHSNWVIYTARGCAEAADFLRRHPIPVILCDSELADGTWRDLLRTAGASAPDSLVIVTSRAADDFLWAEVLNLGGYDVLMKPFDPDEVIRVISLAWLHWKNLRERIKMREALLAGQV